MDRGLSPLSLESLLITAGEHIDLIKLGWGTAYVSGAVADKVAICRDAGIAICPGGTLLEIAVHQGRSTPTSSGCASSGSTTSRSPTARCRSTASARPS